MRSFARFNPALKPGRRIKITLKGVVTSVNKNASVMRVKTDCPGDELAFGAADDIKVEFDGESVADIMQQAEEAVEKIEARNGLQVGQLYIDRAGSVWRYASPSPNPWRLWAAGESAEPTRFDYPQRPLRKIAVGMTVAEEPEYEVGAIYVDSQRRNFLRGRYGWTLLNTDGDALYGHAPAFPVRKFGDR